MNAGRFTFLLTNTNGNLHTRYTNMYRGIRYPLKRIRNANAEAVQSFRNRVDPPHRRRVRAQLTLHTRLGYLFILDDVSMVCDAMRCEAMRCDGRHYVTECTTPNDTKSKWNLSSRESVPSRVGIDVRTQTDMQFVRRCYALDRVC